MKCLAAFTLMTAGALFLLSCAANVFQTAYPTLGDGKYDSEFPYRDCSKQLNEVSQSIKMLYATAYYKTYFFSQDARIRMYELTREDILKKATVSYSHNSVVGTGTVIYYDNKRVALLTCSHIVDFDDSVITYYSKEGETGTIRSFSVLEKQINFIKDIPEGGEMEVLARDKENDIALIGKQFREEHPIGVPVFRYPIGRSKDLEWGTFIYIIGYPMGYKMITKGIVSSPNRDKKGSFLTDAPFNRGFSGGAVLAIRDGVPNFELVGLAKSVSAQYEYILTPGKNYDAAAYDPGIPYQGESFVELKTDIRYGITNVISTELIKEFIERNENQLIRKGFDLRYLFKKEETR